MHRVLSHRRFFSNRLVSILSRPVDTFLDCFSIVTRFSSTSLDLFSTCSRLFTTFLDFSRLFPTCLNFYRLFLDFSRLFSTCFDFWARIGLFRAPGASNWAIFPRATARFDHTSKRLGPRTLQSETAKFRCVYIYIYMCLFVLLFFIYLFICAATI